MSRTTTTNNTGGDMPTNETAGEFLGRLGTDGAAWAEEFAKVAQSDDALDPTPGGLLHGWFANAIEAGRTAGFMDAVNNPAEVEVVRNALAIEPRGVQS